jgi:transposase-like protein
MSTMTKPQSLSEYDRAMLRATLAFSGTAPAVFMNENIRGVLGADEACMTCPRCGSAAQGRNDGGKPCQDFKCDSCCYVFAKST